MTLTPWYDPSIKPVRPGVYEVRARERARWFRRWTGQFWLCGDSTIEGAASTPGKDRALFLQAWRGLAQDPNAQQAGAA